MMATCPRLGPRGKVRPRASRGSLNLQASWLRGSCARKTKRRTSCSRSKRVSSRKKLKRRKKGDSASPGGVGHGVGSSKGGQPPGKGTSAAVMLGKAISWGSFLRDAGAVEASEFEDAGVLDGWSVGFIRTESPSLSRYAPRRVWTPRTRRQEVEVSGVLLRMLLVNEGG